MHPKVYPAALGLSLALSSSLTLQMAVGAGTLFMRPLPSPHLQELVIEFFRIPGPLDKAAPFH